MAADGPRWGRKAAQALVTVAVAGALVAAATFARMALGLYLGILSPFMLYVGAVLAAGLLRGPVCGALVMAAGGVIGLRLFLAPNGASAEGAALAMVIFWCVSTPVLLVANELRVQLVEAMARLSAAVRGRSDGVA